MRTVSVLRGGVGEEHDVSLKTGMNVLRRLEHSEYRPVDVYIDRSGVWYVRGMPLAPQRALSSTDVVFNALHGHYGEDGGVQRELERLGVPYTGSGPLASSIAMNKVLAKEMLSPYGIKTARHITLTVTPDLETRLIELFRTFPQPVVVKPINSGSSVGVTLANGFIEFGNAVKKAFQYAKEVMVEEYIRGREATVGVIDKLRGSDIYKLPPVEIILPNKNQIFDYDAKYGGATREECPASFNRADVEALEDAAAVVHERLGLRHYSRSDFIVTKHGPYFLEVNTLPGLTDQSLLPKALTAVGVSMDEFLTHVLSLALESR